MRFNTIFVSFGSGLLLLATLYVFIFIRQNFFTCPWSVIQSIAYVVMVCG